MLVYVLTFILSCLHLSWGRQYENYKKYDKWETSLLAPERLAQAMQQYVQATSQRVSEMHTMRFMYEESPHYELGYVMHEVIDRRMVFHVHRPMKYQADAVFATLKRTELIQHHYFEVYHLVNMMHEIQKKYAYLPEFKDLENEINLVKVLEEQAIQKEKDRFERRDKKITQKYMQKFKEIEGYIENKENKIIKRVPSLWPIDYGWEVSVWW